MEDGADRRERFQRAQLIMLAFISTVVIGWALGQMSIFILPVIIAFFVAVLLHPLERHLADRLPRRLRWLGLVVAMACFIGAIVIFCLLLWYASERVAGQSGQLADQVQNLMDQGRQWLRQRGLNVGSGTPAGGSGIAGFDIRSEVAGFAAAIANSFGYILAGVTLIGFVVLLMLIEARQWSEKSTAILDDGPRERLSSIVSGMSSALRVYLAVRTFLSLLSGVLAGLWLWMMGVPLAAVFGLLTFLLNFIPSIGSVISVVLPVLVVLATQGFVPALIVFAGLLAIEQVIGNYVDPRMQGRRLNMSPLIVLLSVVAWSAVWGIPGAFIGVPVTMCLVIVFAHIDRLRPLALLLSADADREAMDRATHGRSAGLRT